MFCPKNKLLEKNYKITKNNDILAGNSKREPTLQGRKKIGQMSFGMCGMCGKCQTIIRTLMANQRRRLLGTALHARRLPAGRGAIVHTSALPTRARRLNWQVSTARSASNSVSCALVVGDLCRLSAVSSPSQSFGSKRMKKYWKTKG